MADIFSVLDKFSDDELRVEISLLKQINITNAVKETGSRLLSGLADLTDSLIKSFNSERGISYEAVRMSDMVKRQMQQLVLCTRPELIDMLTHLLYEKCGITDEAVTKEKAGIMIITAAADTYNISKYETPANKIEEVSIEYNKAYLTMLHRILISQTPEQQKQTDKAIQQRMNEVSMEVKRELQKRIMPKEFSGTGIGRVLRLEKRTGYLADVTELLGDDIFDTLTAHIMAVITVVRRLKSTGRGMLARFVWNIRRVNNESFVVPNDRLPSYISPDKEPEKLAAEKELRNMLRNRLDTDKEIEMLTQKLESLSEKQELIKEKYEQECEIYEQINERMTELSEKQDKYINGIASDDEKKQYFNDVNAAKREIDRQKLIVAGCSDNIESNYAQQEEAEKKLEELKKLSEQLHIETDDAVREIAGIIRVNWSRTFTRFVFGPGLFEALVLEFTNRELVAIERLLYEINESKEIASYETGEGCVGVMLSGKKNAVIMFEKQAITKITLMK